MVSVNNVSADFSSPCGVYTLTFDVNQQVAYAYLKTVATIVGDVWVYNRLPAPDRSEWADRRNLPFANCKDFTKDEGQIEKLVTIDDIKFEWKYSAGQLTAHLYLFGDLVASVTPGKKPGRARFASKDGPIAKSMG